jgi:hypothetical protein
MYGCSVVMCVAHCSSMSSVGETPLARFSGYRLTTSPIGAWSFMRSVEVDEYAQDGFADLYKTGLDQLDRLGV